MRRRRMISPAFILILFSLVFSNSVSGQEQNNEAPGISDEAPGELVHLSLGDSSVSLRLSGRWKGSLQAGLGFAFTPLGTMFITDDTPLFTQEGDLFLSLWIRDRWFVEASFMDDSALNTYRAGYQGLEGEVIRYLGVGNTGLDFPSFPYLDLGGDTPSSIGAYGHFSVGNLSLHSMVRYDAAAREERVFVGNRERSFSYADLSRPQRGVSFVLPDENLGETPIVFIQDNKGNITDSDGRKWRTAESSEYAVSTRYGLLELTLGAYTGGASEPETMIAVYYPHGLPGYSIGTYDDPLSLVDPSRPFLAAAQNYFDPSKTEICLWEYPQPGQKTAFAQGDPLARFNNVPATVVIDGYEALVIYEKGAFSPFEKQNRYLAPANTANSAELVKLSSGEIIRGFEIIPMEMENSIREEFIINTDLNRVMRGIYEMIPEGSRDRQSATERWPMGGHSMDLYYPELYLPGRLAFTEDIGIRYTNYSAPGAFSIGTDVVPGSVQVFRNGILDPNFSYSSSSGTVSLTNPAAFSEVIRITYLRQSTETRLGSLAAGIGAIWNPNEHFSGKLGIGLRWNVSGDSYSENGASSPGTVGLGAEAKWDNQRLKAGLSLGLGFEQPDTTGLYRVAGMEGSEWILPLPPESSFISEPHNSFLTDKRTNLFYRNYRESSILSGTSLADITDNADGRIVSEKTGPYPAYDSRFKSQVLVADFNFTAGKTWTGFQTPLGLNGEFLEQAQKIEIPYRFFGFSRTPEDNELTVFIQFGSLADKDSGNPEAPNLVTETQIYLPQFTEDSNGNDFDDIERIATIPLSDADRIKLQGAKYLRLFIKWDETKSLEDLAGRIILAPPMVRGANWRPIIKENDEIKPARSLIYENPEVKAVEDNDSALELKYPDVINRLHSERSRQQVLNISWKDNSSLKDFFSDGNGPGADGRLAALPLSSYRSLSFFVRRPRAASYNPLFESNDSANNSGQVKLDEGKLKFFLAQGPSSLGNQKEIALDVIIPLRAFEEIPEEKKVKPGEWTRVDIQYSGGSKKVLVSGIEVSGASVEYSSAAASKITGENTPAGNTVYGEGNSSYAAFLLIPGDSLALPDGNMAIDEIILEDPTPSYRLNNGASVEWAKPGTIIKIRDIPVVSDFSVQAAIETGAEGNPFETGSDGSFGMNGRSRAEVSLLGIRLTGNYSYSFSNMGADKNYTWSAGHSISRSFGPFSVYESFDNAPSDRTMNHRLAMSLATRVRGNLSGEAIFENDRLHRRWLAGSSGKPSEKAPFNFTVDASAAKLEKTEANEKTFSNYAETWAKSFSDLLPDSGSGAERRDMQGNIRMRLDTSPLGTELLFQGTSLFSQLDEISQSGSLLRLDFPIRTVKTDLHMLIRAEREYRRSLFSLSADFPDDTRNWARSFGGASSMMFSIPLYSLFDTRMEDRMGKFNSDTNANIGQFADRYEFSLQKAQNYGISSFFLPRRFAFRMGRILEKRLDTPRDTLNLAAAFGFSSINMFGTMGIKPLFSFYQNDDFSHSLETQLAFPKNETVSWSVRSDQAMRFYSFSGAELSLNNTLTINSSSRIGEGSRWTNNLSVLWDVPMETTLLGRLYYILAGMASRQGSWLTLANLAVSDYELIRRESLEFVLERIPSVSYGDYFQFSIIAGHESIVRIFGKLNLSVFGKLKVTEDFNTHILSFLGSIGTSLNLMF